MHASRKGKAMLDILARTFMIATLLDDAPPTWRGQAAPRRRERWQVGRRGRDL
jgi:hypothetical protein